MLSYLKKNFHIFLVVFVLFFLGLLLLKLPGGITGMVTGVGLGEDLGVQSVLSCGSNVPNTTTLSANIINCNSSNGLNITGSHITLDCNGFNINGSISYGTLNTGVYVQQNVTNVTITNCNITGFHSNIKVEGNFTNITGNNLIRGGLAGILINNVASDEPLVANTSITFNTIQGDIGSSNSLSGIQVVDAEDVDVFYNNISYFLDGVSLAGGGVDEHKRVNVSFNNIINNSRYSLDVTNANEEIFVQFNYWNYSTCSNITSTFDGDNNDYILEPILDSFYPSGSVTACEDFCGMALRESRTLSSNILGCSTNAIEIIKNDTTLDCNSFEVRGDSSGTIKGIAVDVAPAFLSGITIRDCNVSNFNYGFYLNDVEYSNFINNTVVNSSLSAYYLNAGVKHSNFTNNTLKHTEGQLDVSGVPGAGFWLGTADSANNTFIGNNISYGGTAAITTRGTFNLFKNNTIYNNSYGYYLDGSFGNNFTGDLLQKNKVAVQTEKGINSVADTYDNYFYETSFLDNVYDLNVTVSTKTNITFVNSSINSSKLTVATSAFAYFLNYVDVNVTDTLKNPLFNATVSAKTSTGLDQNSRTTKANGVARLEILEYFNNGGTNFFVTPSTITARKTNYTENSTNVSVLNRKYVSTDIILTSILCGNTITTSFSLGNDYYCSGDGFIIGATNISVDGNSHTIWGKNNGKGLVVNNYNRLSVTNLNIRNFSTGLYLDNSSHSSFGNMIISNNTYGIIFNKSFNNSVFNGNITNSTNFAILSIVGSSSLKNNSLVNVSVDLNTLNASGNTTILIKWFADINTSFNNHSTLTNANVSGHFNSTHDPTDPKGGILDYTTKSDNSGLGRLQLIEAVVNNTFVKYLTPHNISSRFTFLGVTYSNYTSINLTLTKSTKLNLNLILNCTTPSGSTHTITESTTYCPGIYNTKTVIAANNLSLTCSGTTLVGTGLVGSDNIGIDIKHRKRVNITGCNLKDFYEGVEVRNSSKIKINNISISKESSSLQTYYGVYCRDNSLNLIVNSSRLSSSSAEDLYLWECNGSTVQYNILVGDYGIDLRESYLNNFTNNTFENSVDSVRITSGSNNYFIYNRFSGNTENYFNYISGSDNHFNTTFQDVTGDFPQGNEYADYCDKGSDANSDGYADAKTTGERDWPYNATISSRINIDSTNNPKFNDYGPRLLTCPPKTVGTTSSSSSSSGETVSGAAPPAPPPAPVGETDSGAAPCTENCQGEAGLKQVTRTTEGELAVLVSLENSGKTPLRLFPELNQDIEDPFYIVTRKTLGFEGSLFDKIASLSYSKKPIAGKLLRATIVNQEELIIPPGGKLDAVVKIKEGLLSSNLKIQFSSIGKEVAVDSDKKEAISGAAVDLNVKDDSLDVYLIIVPKDLLGNNGNKLTGATISSEESDDYLVEINLNKKIKGKGFFGFIKKTFFGESAFSDLYGPYKITQEQSLIFAQQFKYNQEVYKGDYTLTSKIFKGGKKVTENEFEIKFE